MIKGVMGGGTCMTPTPVMSIEFRTKVERRVMTSGTRMQSGICKATSKMRAYQATQRLGRSFNTKTKEYSG